jgi:hypothetical protein
VCCILASKKLKSELHFGEARQFKKRKLRNRNRKSVATRAGDNNPANIATPALESHQHPQLADPVCHDSGSVLDGSTVTVMRDDSRPRTINLSRRCAHAPPS